MKKIIVVISIVALYILLAFVISNYVGNDTYLLMGENVRFHYHNGEWTNDENEEKYTNCQVYDKNDYSYLGKYTASYTSDWHIDMNKSVINNDVLLFRSNKKLKLLSIKRNYELEDSEVKKALAKFKLPTDGYLGYYVSADIDNDGNIEYIYSITNVDVGMYRKASEYYTLIYMVKDNDIIEISLEKSNMYLSSVYEIGYILNVDKNSDYELIITKGGIIKETNEMYADMYGLIDGKYVKLVGTN